MTDKYTNRDIAMANKSSNDTSVRRFYSSIGMEEMNAAIAHSSDDRAKKLFERLFDPHYKNRDFAKLCWECGLTMGDVVDMFRKYKLDIGIIKMSSHVPAILEDTAKGACNSEVYCKRCDGLGEISTGDNSTRTCPACKGSKKVMEPGNKDDKKLTADIMGLTKHAPLVANQINVGRFDIGKLVDDVEKIVQ